MSIRTKLHERSLVLLKPDAVQRGLVGDIISRFEKKGLKITAMKMVWPTRELASKHYDQPESAARGLGQKTIDFYKEKGEKYWTDDPMTIAKKIQGQLVSLMMTGPVVAMVIEGAHAVSHVRKIRGGTNPLTADVGTITGDFTIDSYIIADQAGRAVRNLAHASGTVEEAESEIKLWFKEKEIMDYDMAIDKILYATEWENGDKD